MSRTGSEQILIVVVRYKTSLAEAQTIVSLAQAFGSDPALFGEYRVLIWDNSPVGLTDPQLSFPFEYGHSTQNLGVSGAYNHALMHAETAGLPWLLLLDQDTVVTADYLRRMAQYVKEVGPDETVATIVPFIRSNGTLVSPRQFGKFIRNHQIPRSRAGVYREDAYAVNSGTVMRTSALRAVGGYSEEFWLDLSDAYIFQALHRHGKYMYIAGDLELEHSVASMNFDQQMSVERYSNFLAAENAYIALYRSRLVNWVQDLWLLARAARQYRRYRNKQFAVVTLKCLGQRIVWSKATCMTKWRATLRSRNIPTVVDGKIVG